MVLEPSELVKACFPEVIEVPEVKVLGGSYLKELEILVLDTLISTGSLTIAWDRLVEESYHQWVTADLGPSNGDMCDPQDKEGNKHRCYRCQAMKLCIS